MIRSAFVVGTGHRQTALLVGCQKAFERTSHDELITEIWPAVQQANEESAKHARILKSHIIFEKPEKPFPRADKGTIQRTPALRLYEEEIDATYRKHGDSEIGGILADTLSGSWKSAV